jgi:hypothetical protein
MIRWALTAVMVSGFSTSTCRLAERAARMWDSWRWLGEQITTASSAS